MNYYHYVQDIKIITGDDLKNWTQNKGIFLIDFMFKLVIALILFWLLSKLLKNISHKIQNRLDNRGVDQIASHFVINLIRYFILVFAVFTIITQLSIVKEASIAALVASAGVGVSLAMQGALSNFAGGILLLVLKPFKKGDYIVIPSTNIEGTVEEIQTYYTTIRTILDEIVLIPNSQLTNNSVINKKGDSTRALLLKVSISYNADVAKAKELLMTVAKDQEGIIADSISVFVEELGDNSVEMGLLCSVPTLQFNPVRRALNETVLIMFKKEGIEIPYNQLDVHIKQ